jgi:hypothetical protein
MQVSRAGVGTEANDEKLSLLRMLNPEVLADPYAHYRPCASLILCTGIHTCTLGWSPLSGSGFGAYELRCGPHAPSCLPGSAWARIHEAVCRGDEAADDVHGWRQPRASARICSTAFAPRRVKAQRTVIASIADELIDKVIASGKMDLIGDFADPLPAIVAATLLSVFRRKITRNCMPGSLTWPKC